MFLRTQRRNHPWLQAEQARCTSQLILYVHIGIGRVAHVPSHVLKYWVPGKLTCLLMSLSTEPPLKTFQNFFHIVVHIKIFHENQFITINNILKHAIAHLIEMHKTCLINIIKYQVFKKAFISKP